MSRNKGPDKPTFVEILTSLIKLPKPVSILVWVVIIGPGLAVLSGTLQFLYYYASYFSNGLDLLQFLTPVEILQLLAQYAVSWIPNTPSGYLILSVWLFSLGYPFYAAPFIRKKLLGGEGAIRPLLETTGPPFSNYFRKFSDPMPQLGIAATIVAIDTVVSILANGVTNLPFILIAETSQYFPATLVVVSLYWSYFASMNGIRQISAKPLKLQNYFSDRFWGLRPAGSLALGLTGVYFGLVGTSLITSLIVRTIAPVGSNVGQASIFSNYSLISDSAFAVFALVLYSLSVRNMHSQMLRKKMKELGILEKRISESIEGNPVQASLTEILSFQKLRFLDEKLSTAATWPYDLRIISSAIAIAIAVVTTLFARIVELVFHIG